MISCVTLKTNHLFHGNIIASMFRLRYRCVIERQAWEVPHWDGMEYDIYDNVATTYFVWCDEENEARGCLRLYPTDRPYMLQQAFSHLVTYDELPQNDKSIWEGSRFCVDQNLPPQLRKRIVHELCVASMEHALRNDIKKIIGLMLPAYWRSVYINSGWDPFWYGEVQRLPNGDKVRAGGLPVSQEMLQKVLRTTGIYNPILDYGRTEVLRNDALEAVA